MNIKITITSDMYESASAIMRALDKDVGGYLSFGQRTVLDENENEITPKTYSTSILGSDEGALYIKDPVLLYKFVFSDYKTRWNELKPPTLAECEAFCNAVTSSNRKEEENIFM